MQIQKSLVQAYQKQVIWVQQTKQEIGGYKAGLTSKGQQNRFGISLPIYAPLFSIGQIKDSIVILERTDIMLETELAFKLKQDIIQPIADIEILKSYIESIHIAIEVPLMNIAPKIITAESVVENGIGSYKFIVGEKIPINENLDDLDITLIRDNVLLYEAKGFDTMGSQWKAILWLVNAIVHQEGYTLHAGNYLLTGALGQMVKAQVGNYIAKYGDNYELNFKVVNAED